MSEIINVKELRVGKGITTQNGETEWHKTYYELVLNTDGFSPELVELHRETAEGYLDRLLHQDMKIQQQEHPDFNPQELLDHEWKGRKTGQNSYAKGSLEYGWDFADKFSPDVLECLPLTINGYRFSLTENKKLVHTEKVKP